uniref:hypothetical protein n=1 Tax=Fulvivirga sp. TaxID=1931237 RepID=UPI00404909B9
MFIRIANNVYASYNQASGTGANHPNGSWAGEIAMGQSFWVDNTAATGSVSLTESMKASLGNGSFLRDEGPATDVLKLKLVGNDEFDETVIFL